MKNENSKSQSMPKRPHRYDWNIAMERETRHATNEEVLESVYEDIRNLFIYEESSASRTSATLDSNSLDLRTEEGVDELEDEIADISLDEEAPEAVDQPRNIEYVEMANDNFLLGSFNETNDTGFCEQEDFTYDEYEDNMIYETTTVDTENFQNNGDNLDNLDDNYDQVGEQFDMSAADTIEQDLLQELNLESSINSPDLQEEKIFYSQNSDMPSDNATYQTNPPRYLDDSTEYPFETNSSTLPINVFPPQSQSVYAPNVGNNFAPNYGVNYIVNVGNNYVVNLNQETETRNNNVLTLNDIGAIPPNLSVSHIHEDINSPPQSQFSLPNMPPYLPDTQTNTNSFVQNRLPNTFAQQTSTIPNYNYGNINYQPTNNAYIQSNSLPIEAQNFLRHVLPNIPLENILITQSIDNNPRNNNCTRAPLVINNQFVENVQPVASNPYLHQNVNAFSTNNANPNPQFNTNFRHFQPPNTQENLFYNNGHNMPNNNIFQTPQLNQVGQSQFQQYNPISQRHLINAQQIQPQMHSTPQSQILTPPQSHVHLRPQQPMFLSQQAQHLPPQHVVPQQQQQHYIPPQQTHPPQMIFSQQPSVIQQTPIIAPQQTQLLTSQSSPMVYQQRPIIMPQQQQILLTQHQQPMQLQAPQPQIFHPQQDVLQFDRNTQQRPFPIQQHQHRITSPPNYNFHRATPQSHYQCPFHKRFQAKEPEHSHMCAHAKKDSSMSSTSKIQYQINDDTSIDMTHFPDLRFEEQEINQSMSSQDNYQSSTPIKLSIISTPSDFSMDTSSEQLTNQTDPIIRTRHQTIFKSHKSETELITTLFRKKIQNRPCIHMGNKPIETVDKEIQYEDITVNDPAIKQMDTSDVLTTLSNEFQASDICFMDDPTYETLQLIGCSYNLESEIDKVDADTKADTADNESTESKINFQEEPFSTSGEDFFVQNILEQTQYVKPTQQSTPNKESNTNSDRPQEESPSKKLTSYKDVLKNSANCRVKKGEPEKHQDKAVAKASLPKIGSRHERRHHKRLHNKQDDQKENKRSTFSESRIFTKRTNKCFNQSESVNQLAQIPIECQSPQTSKQASTGTPTKSIDSPVTTAPRPHSPQNIEKINPQVGKKRKAGRNKIKPEKKEKIVETPDDTASNSTKGKENVGTSSMSESGLSEGHKQHSNESSNEAERCRRKRRKRKPRMQKNRRNDNLADNTESKRSKKQRKRHRKEKKQSKIEEERPFMTEDLQIFDTEPGVQKLHENACKQIIKIIEEISHSHLASSCLEEFKLAKRIKYDPLPIIEPKKKEKPRCLERMPLQNVGRLPLLPTPCLDPIIEYDIENGHSNVARQTYGRKKTTNTENTDQEAKKYSQAFTNYLNQTIEEVKTPDIDLILTENKIIIDDKANNTELNVSFDVKKPKQKDERGELLRKLRQKKKYERMQYAPTKKLELPKYDKSAEGITRHGFTKKEIETIMFSKISVPEKDLRITKKFKFERREKLPDPVIKPYERNHPAYSRLDNPIPHTSKTSDIYFPFEGDSNDRVYSNLDWTVTEINDCDIIEYQNPVEGLHKSDNEDDKNMSKKNCKPKKSKKKEG